jgi:hypothetical protein
LFSAFFTASSITGTIFAGSSRIDMWQVERIVVFAPIFFAANSLAMKDIRQVLLTLELASVELQ